MDEEVQYSSMMSLRAGDLFKLSPNGHIYEVVELYGNGNFANYKVRQVGSTKIVKKPYTTQIIKIQSL